MVDIKIASLRAFNFRVPVRSIRGSSTLIYLNMSQCCGRKVLMELRVSGEELDSIINCM